MCDGVFCEKLKIIRDLEAIEAPEEPEEYLQKHMTWTLDELKKYRNKIRPAGSRKRSLPIRHLL